MGAASLGHIEIVRMLLAIPNIDVNLQNKVSLAMDDHLYIGTNYVHSTVFVLFLLEVGDYSGCV